jgi:hypothetical protein
MLFGRLLAPYQRLAAEVRGTRPPPLARRGHPARRLLSLVVLPLRVDGIMDDYAELDRLDREELDE